MRNLTIWNKGDEMKLIILKTSDLMTKLAIRKRLNTIHL